MARSRNIKPGLFRNEVLGEADPIYSLFFAGLWTIADKEGRLEYRPKRIKADIFPYRSDFDPCLALDWLMHKSFINVYEIDQKKYIQINNWKKHQSPHHKEIDSVIPELSEDNICDTNQDDMQACGKHGSSMAQASVNKIASCPTDSLSSDSLSSDSLKKTSSCAKQSFTPDEKVTKFDKTPYEEILNLYHEILPELNSVKKLTPARKTQIKTRWRNELDSLDEWRDYFELVRESGFLMGKTDPGRYRSKSWQADIDWLIKQGNVVKVCEGKYHGHG